MTSYPFKLISHGGMFFRTHSFGSKLVLPAKRNIMSRDQTERSKWSRKQAQSLILGIFLIIIIIIRCSGMFRNVPGCSGMFHVPDFIDDPKCPAVINFYRIFAEDSFKLLNLMFLQKCRARITKIMFIFKMTKYPSSGIVVLHLLKSAVRDRYLSSYDKKVLSNLIKRCNVYLE